MSEYTTTENLEGNTKERHPWLRNSIIGIVVIASIFAGWYFLSRNGSQEEAAKLIELNFEEIVIADLYQEESYDGTLGSLEDDPVRTQIGGTITDITEAGDVIGQGEVLLSIDDQPIILLYGDLPAYRDITIGEELVNVSRQLSGSITWMAETGTLIEQGDVLYRIDNQPVVVLYGDQPAYQTLEYDYWIPTEANITSSQSSVAFSEEALNNALAAYTPYINLPDDDLSKAHYGSIWASAQEAYNSAIYYNNLITDTETNYLSGYDVSQLQNALIQLGYDPNSYVTVNGEFDYLTQQMVYRWQAFIGSDYDGIVDFGEVVFLPGPSQVIEHFLPLGSQSSGYVLSVASGEPANGTDILQLEEALVALGYDAEGNLIADGIYSTETTQAVLAFQSDKGLDQDGIIDLGEVIFLSGEVRITEQLVPKGVSVGIGSAVLGISLSEKIISIDLPANQQGALEVGDKVLVEMPDNSEVPATVTFVSRTASKIGNNPATFEVLVSLDDPSNAAGLDEAPVDVIVISDSVENVLVVPVSALLALLEGGYAVELDTGNGTMRYVGVEVGFFGSDNRIEIISSELQAGDRVLVP